MSKLLVSDFHVRETGSYLFLNELKLVNLDTVFDERKDKVDRIVVMGDFFNNPNPSHSLVARCAVPFEKLGEHISKVVFFPGNHDPIFKSESPFSAFASGTRTSGKGMNLVTADKPFFDEEFKAVYCAWSKGELPKAPALDWDFFGHVQIRDWVKFTNAGFTLAELEKLGYRKYYFGDFHPFVDQGKFVSVGTFGASDFGDEGLKSGYVIANDDGGFVRRILDYPVFKRFDLYVKDGKITNNLPHQRHVKGNIVKIMLHGVDKDLTNEVVEGVRDFFNAEDKPLKLSVEKVYEEVAQTEKKPLLSLAEIFEKHWNGWPDAARVEYDKLKEQSV